MCCANLLNSLLFFCSMCGRHGYGRRCFALMKLWNQEGKESGVILRRNRNLFDRPQAITIETEDMNVKAGAVFRPGMIVLSLSVWVTRSVLYSWLPVWASTVPHCSRATAHVPWATWVYTANMKRYRCFLRKDARHTSWQGVALVLWIVGEASSYHICFVSWHQTLRTPVLKLIRLPQLHPL